MHDRLVSDVFGDELFHQFSDRGVGHEQAKRRGCVVLGRIDSHDLCLKTGAVAEPGQIRPPYAYGIDLFDVKRSTVGLNEPALNDDGLTVTVGPEVIEPHELEELRDDRLESPHDQTGDEAAGAAVEQRDHGEYQPKDPPKQRPGRLREIAVLDDLSETEMNQRRMFGVAFRRGGDGGTGPVGRAEGLGIDETADLLAQIRFEDKRDIGVGGIDSRIDVELQRDSPGDPVKHVTGNVDRGDAVVRDRTIGLGNKIPSYCHFFRAELDSSGPPEHDDRNGDCQCDQEQNTCGDQSGG